MLDLAAGVAAFMLVRAGRGGSPDKEIYKPNCKWCVNFFDGEFCQQGRVSSDGKLVLANGSMIPIERAAKARDMREPDAPCGPYGNQYQQKPGADFIEWLAPAGIAAFAVISFLIWLAA
jgi:hypothetical protein